MLKGLCFGTRAGSPGSKHLRKHYLDAMEGGDPWYEADRDLVPQRLPSAPGPLCWSVGLQVNASAPTAVACSGKKFPFVIHNHLSSNSLLTFQFPAAPSFMVQSQPSEEAVAWSWYPAQSLLFISSLPVPIAKKGALCWRSGEKTPHNLVCFATKL